MLRRVLIALLLLGGVAAAQDERRVSSPDGQLEFRIGVTQQEKGGLSRLAYQLYYRGARVVDTSYLGFDIHNQEPLLGENTGLITTHSAEGREYNSLTVEYMQNGSLGRRLVVEVRAANSGVAFRYVIPKTSPVEQLLIDEEDTEFAIGGGAGTDSSAPIALPFAARRAGGGWISVSESGAGNYPPASLVRDSDGVLVTRLAASFDGTTPLTCPWRVIRVAPRREGLTQPDLIRSLQL